MNGVKESVLFECIRDKAFFEMAPFAKYKPVFKRIQRRRRAGGCRKCNEAAAKSMEHGLFVTVRARLENMADVPDDIRRFIAKKIDKRG